MVEGTGHGREAAGAQAPPALPPRFRVEALLGSGGQADVWLVHDLELDQRVALKLFRPSLDPVAGERLRREVRLGRELAHPRLLRMFELVEAGGSLGVVMELAPGGTLARKLRQGPLPLDEVVRAGREVLEALAYLHGRGVLHRDVKPSNVLLDAGGGARLADFGLARPIGEGADLTRTSVTVGTPGFMSPEQLRGEDACPASDLYGLGVTLYQLLTGRAPFSGSSEFEVARQHLTETPRSPRLHRPDCPGWLAAFVLRLLEKRPADRFPSAEAALAALGAGRVAASPRARRARALRWGAAAAGLLLVAAGAALAARAARRTAVRVTPSGSVLTGRATDGSEVYSIRFRSPIRQLLEVDLGPYGGAATVATAVPDVVSGPQRRAPSEIAAVDRRGRELLHANVEDLVLEWGFPYPKVLTPSVHAFDLTGDGVSELVVVADQRAFYPSVVLVYWPEQKRWDVVLRNEGHFWKLVGSHRDGVGRLHYFAAANRLGYVGLCGAVRVAPPAATPEPGRGGLPLSGAEGYQGVEPEWATLIPLSVSATAELEPVLAPDGTFTLRNAVASHRFDRFGNPLQGPLAGRDLSRERVRFLAALDALGLTAPPRMPAVVEAQAAEVRSRFAELLGEPANRMALALVTARALAAAGDVPAGIGVLRRTIDAGDGNVDLSWRLAHLEAILGDLASARRRTEELAAAGASYRSTYDAPLLLVRLLVEMREKAQLEALAPRVLHVDGSSAEREQVAAVVRLRAHLFWDEAGLEELSVASSAHFPEAEALACLARWRLGKLLPGDVAAMEAGERDAPDAAGEFRLARAAALLGSGQARKALEAVTALAGSLGASARVDFADRQTLDLAEALRVVALRAAGEEGRARAEAQRLLAQLRPGLLPRRLAEETLAVPGR